MKHLLVLLGLLASSGIYSQSGSLKGRITDFEMGGEPLMFASVAIDGLESGTATNFNGNFEFDNLAPGTYTVEISSLGYETVRIPVEISANETLRIEEALHAKSISLQDVSAVDNTKQKGAVVSRAYAGQ
ncbi:carboxypeptidase-like regulatory domain-containing protein [Pseudozobellia thermophila]|uniref:Carboxypeptidase regulatory-like domain-containing protein n=1 Tax=Pseudozobellia thermophila TaxID=192903 RepID=A0A1M6C4P2_9FLAO|nr:carboxypeptidase-like regulatory domain-containing protein [Pseudozobellia thermophila]SHI55986.1 Carboxypeptidase regulatory-like domain-containing protein [Pseudozobellia thermophila]